MIPHRIAKFAMPILLGILATLLVAAPVLALAYSATLAIIEGNGTDYDNIPLYFFVSNESMADNGFMQVDALDTRVGTEGGIPYPHLVAEDRTLASIGLPASYQLNLRYSTGNTALAAMAMVLGYGGYITVDDNATLELADEFDVEIDGYFDTAVNDNIVYKNGSFVLDCDGVGNITAELTGTGKSVTAAVTSGEHVIIVQTEER